MHVTSFSLQGFKCFSAPTVLPFASRLTALIGPNRSGKTSVLQALALLGFISKNDRRSDTGEFIAGPSDGIRTASQHIAGPLEPLFSGTGSEENKITMCLRFSDCSAVSTTVTYENGVTSLSSDCAPDSHMLRVTYVPRDMTFPHTTDEKIHKPEVTEMLELAATGNLTAHYVAALKEANLLPTLSGMMEKVFPGVGRVEIASTRKVHRLRFSRNDHLFPWYREGSGVCFVLTIFAAILYDRTTRFASATNVADSASFQYHHLVVLDEPSSALHPQVIPAFLDALFSLDVQIVLSTHSVDFLLRSANIPEQYMQCVSLEDSPLVLRPQVTDSLLESLGLSAEAIREALPQQGQETAVLASLSAGKRILYVEGRDDILALKAFMDVVDSSRAACFNSRVIFEWTSGRKKVSEYAQTAGTLASFLESWRATGEGRKPSKTIAKGERLRVAILVDRDYRPDEVIDFEIKAFATALQNKPLIASPPDSLYLTWGKAVEWENYLIDREALKAVLQRAGPDATQSFDGSLKKYVLAGRSKLVKEFGTSVAFVQSDKAGKEALKDKDLGSIFEAMWERFCTDPDWGMDAKGFLQELRLYDVESWKLILDEIVRGGLHKDITDVVDRLFQWAGV